jgi:hypothetical protein
MMLVQFGAPALLEATKDPSTRSFRVSTFSALSTFQISVRLNIDPDGSGHLTSATIADNNPAIQKKPLNISATDVYKFLQLVDKAELLVDARH